VRLRPIVRPLSPAALPALSDLRGLGTACPGPATVARTWPLHLCPAVPCWDPRVLSALDQVHCGQGHCAEARPAVNELQPKAHESQQLHAKFAQTLVHSWHIHTSC